MVEVVEVHGTAIAVAGYAVLMRGKSGAGKSDLALRCLALPVGPFVAQAPVLIADDWVRVTTSPDGLAVSAPHQLQGLIEVRGVGIVQVAFSVEAKLALVADLVEPTRIERLPLALEPVEIAGHPVPRLLIAPFEGSAPLKVLIALAAVARGEPLVPE